MWFVEVKLLSGEIRYKYKDRMKNPNTGKYVNACITLKGKTKQAQKQAQEILFSKLQEKIKSVADKRAEALKGLKLYKVVDEWYKSLEGKRKPETMQSILSYVKRIKKGTSEDLLFTDFTPAIAEKIVEDMYYREKLSYSYSHETLITIKRIIKYAKKWQYINDVSEFLELKLEKRPATPEELQKAKNKFLDKDELKTYLSKLGEINKRLALAMEFVSLTGLRCGELLALRVQDYDRQKRAININGTITKSAKNGEDAQRGTPKNMFSYRMVELSERAVNIIEWFILENKKSAQWHSRTYKDRGYIFTTQNGFPYDIHYVNRILCKLDYLGKHVSTHVFRHTHISLLAELGVELKAIMERVGHNDPATTLSIYTHVTNKMKDETINKLNSLVI